MNDNIRFDRLVDGELTDAQRRELLGRLDAEPDGWRRCALAFLEAQEWQNTARSVVAEPTVELKSVAAVATPEPTRRHDWSATALAASVAIALLVGFAGGDRWRMAQSGGASEASVGEIVDASDTVADASPVDTSIAVANDTSEIDTVAQTVGWNGPRMRVGFLAVQSDADGTLSHVPINVVEGPGVDESWLEQVPPAISARYVELLRRRGYDVQQQRQIVPFDIDGSQQVMLPVDRVKITPVVDVAY